MLLQFQKKEIQWKSETLKVASAKGLFLGEMPPGPTLLGKLRFFVAAIVARLGHFSVATMLLQLLVILGCHSTK